MNTDYRAAWLRAEQDIRTLEAEVARLQTGIAQQLGRLDVAITHIEIIRRKGDDYTATERDNIAAIVEQHAREARAALFALLADQQPDTPGKDGAA